LRNPRRSELADRGRTQESLPLLEPFAARWAVTDRARELEESKLEEVYNSLVGVANEGLVELCARASRDLSGSTRERIAKSVGGVKG
jgi:hypothetical protein